MHLNNWRKKRYNLSAHPIHPKAMGTIHRQGYPNPHGAAGYGCAAPAGFAPEAGRISRRIPGPDDSFSQHFAHAFLCRLGNYPIVASSGPQHTAKNGCAFLCGRGYVAGTIYCFYAGLGRIERIVYLTYFLSGTIIALFSFCLHLKSSGMAGPLLMLGLEVNPWFFLGFMLLGIVFWSSLCLRRHTAGELLLGAGTTMGIILLLQQIL